MKTSSIIFKKVLTILTSVIVVQVYAQVGINTTTPHSSSALDIVSDTAGLLIPRMDKTSRLNIPNPADALLVFDTDYGMYFCFKNGQWYTLNGFTSTITPNGGHVDSLSVTNGKVGIGISNPTEKLHVIGNIKNSGNIVSGGSVTAVRVYGEGTTPSGGIIMWSGTIATIPPGWALCDGSVVNLPQGGTYSTPNLSGRFIVGYDSSDPEYTMNNTGPRYTDADGTSNGSNTSDAKQIRLLSVQSGLPVHSHAASADPHSHDYIDETQYGLVKAVGNGNGRDATDPWQVNRATRTSFDTTVIVKIQDSVPLNAVLAFENRPPFYVLAYIIKLPC